jgi:ribose-phosphate pyrophosphokinase
MAELLGIDFALIHKERKRREDFHSSSNTTNISHLMLVGDVKDRTVLLVDDMADTCNTLIKAAVVCLAHGASKVYALVSHGIFSGNALERLQASPITQIVVSESLQMQEPLKRCNKLKVLDIAPLFAEAIRRIHYGESVSFLFDRVPI